MTTPIPEGTEYRNAQHSDSDSQDMAIVLQELKGRVTDFEAKMESAILKEENFRNDIQCLTKSLDTFVARHLEEDRLLTDMVNRDTQRSLAAKEGYDELASQFDETKKGGSRTRIREFMGKVFVYVSIVIPFVLMAPLHAIFWLIGRLLKRLGFRKPAPSDSVYARSASRKRDGRASPSILRVSKPSSTPTRSQLTSLKAGKHGSDGIRALEQLKDIDADASSIRYGLRKQKNPTNQSEILHETDNTIETDDTRDSLRSESTGQSTSVTRPEDVEKHVIDESSGSEDVFMDASDGIERVQSQARDDAILSSGDAISGDGEDDSDPSEATRRPGWARLPEGNESLPDFAAFPSSPTFWEISDDEMQLASQDKEASRQEEE